MSGRHAAPSRSRLARQHGRGPGAQPAEAPPGGAVAGAGGSSLAGPAAASAAALAPGQVHSGAGQAVPDAPPARRRLRVVSASPAAIVGLSIVAAVALLCFVGPLVYHGNISRVRFAVASQPPSASHPLGTDSNGLDVLAELMSGGQLSLAVGAGAGLLAAAIGSLWGAVAGYLGGVADAIMMRIVDAAIAIPALVLILLLSAMHSPTGPFLLLVIAATSWLSTARLVRGAALTLRTREFVQAARLMGAGRLRIVARHVAPNTLRTIAVSVSFQIADAIVLLATLSYLNLGIKPPSVDWGDMIASGTQLIYDGYWWQILPAGAAIALVVLGLHLAGDGLADRLGPGARRR